MKKFSFLSFWTIFVENEGFFVILPLTIVLLSKFIKLVPCLDFDRSISSEKNFFLWLFGKLMVEEEVFVGERS